MKKTLLFMLLIALMMPAAMNGQETRPITSMKIKGMNDRPTINLSGLQVNAMPADLNRDSQTLTVNDGTTTNNYVPIPGSSVGNGIETEFIIPAETLADMAPEDGYYSNINSLTFYTSRTGQNASWGSGKFLVFLQEYSSEDDIPDFFFDPNDMTLVYYGSLSVSSKEMTVSFNQVDGFEYFGGYLTVCFYEYTNGTASQVAWYGVTAQYAAAYWDGSSGAYAHFLPKMTFTYTTEVATCVIPNNLVASNVTTTTADLSWNERGASESWQVIYCSATDTLGLVVSETPACTLEDLTEGTEYDVYIRSVCDEANEEYTDWAMVSFETHTTCEAPSDLVVSNISSNSADLSWTGYADAYNLRYREYAEHDTDNFTQVDDDTTTGSDFTEYEFDLSSYSGQGYIAIRHYNVTDMFLLDIQSIAVYDADDNEVLVTDFSSGIGIPDGWHNIDVDGDGYKWGNAGSYVYSASFVNGYGAVNPDNWLVTPLVDLGGVVVVTAKGQDSSYCEEVFGVFVSTTKLEENEWILVNDIVDSNYTLENLEMGITYEVQVTASCETPDWSDNVLFTTPSNLFVNDGDWNDSNNWYSGEVPAEGADVVINAACTIPANYTAIAGNITIGETGSLTIENNGQLIHTNEGVVATVKKAIAPYQGEKDNYYLISPPVNDAEYYPSYKVLFPEDVTNMLENNYDLYSFNYAAEDGLEWLNYKAGSFTYMRKGFGYLYANSAKTTLEFTGVLNPAPYGSLDYVSGYYLPYSEEGDYDFPNWTLAGNPYLCDIYLAVLDISNSEFSYDFYVMNGDEIALTETGVIAPMEGAFVISSAASNDVVVGQAAVESGSKIRGNALTLSLSQNDKFVDAARVRFNEGKAMPKFQLNPNHTKLFFTKDNKDYAVVNTENQGEMPINFKAENNGTYTLSFSVENVEFGYLHLIDNLTGNDVDLLATPSYTFNAKATDYTSRFKLVFSANNGTNENVTLSDSFAYYNNGNLVVNNEGDATLNIVDVLGRTVSTHNINGSENVSVNIPAGVYMLQLVNGDNVKTQKVVVK